MSLAALASSKPRERSGAQTFARYNFQANASIDQILTRHEDGKDYVAVLDYHEDLAIIENPSGQSALYNYQIKGKASGAWTVVGLTSLEKDSAIPGSIVGKMYTAATATSPHATIAAFLSNASYRFTLKNPTGTKTGPSDIDIPCHALSDSEKKKIADRLNLDVSEVPGFSHEDIFRFQVTTVPIKGHDEFIIGRISKYFDKFGQQVPATAVHRVLISEVVDRCMNADTCSDANALQLKKALSRADVEKVFSAAAHRTRTIVDDFDLLKAELLSQGWQIREIIGLQSGCVEYVQRRSRADPLLADLAAHVEQVAAIASNQINASGTLSEIVAILAAPNLASTTGIDGWLLQGALFTEAHALLQ